MTYQELTKPEYQQRMAEFRIYLTSKVMPMGESVMPHDVAEAMMKADNSGKFKNLLFNGFENIYGKFLMLIDVYEGCGLGEMPEDEKDLNLLNVQNYF